MAFKTVKSIEKALTVVDSKKENLRIALEQLQSHSSFVSQFNFTWDDLDSYFTSIQSQLIHNFSTLRAIEESSRVLKPKPAKRNGSSFLESVPARPELNSICEKMDGLGLLKYVIDRPKERSAIRAELADALKHAPDAGTIVLDALEGFWDGKQSGLRNGCVVLLEHLMTSGVHIGVEVRERAKGVAVEWKGKMAVLSGGNGGDGNEEGKEEEGGLEMLAYLQLLASYKLLDDGEYDVNELIDYVVLVARYKQAVELCRVLGLESKVSDVVQKLIGKGKQFEAVKLILEFELSDEYPPLPLLKAYVMDTKNLAQKVRKSGKNHPRSLNQAATKEISALKSVIKCIEDYGLESEYPKDELVARVDMLEKEKANRKRPVPAPVPKPKQNVNQPKQNGNKRMKGTDHASPFQRKQPSQSSSVIRAGLLPDYHAGPYGLAGPHGPGAQYVGPPADVYGLPGPHLGLSGNVNPSTSNPYPLQTHPQAGYHDSAMAYGAYDPSQYHPVYYPQ